MFTFQTHPQTQIQTDDNLYYKRSDPSNNKMEDAGLVDLLQRRSYDPLMNSRITSRSIGETAKTFNTSAREGDLRLRSWQGLPIGFGPNSVRTSCWACTLANSTALRA